MKFDSWNWVQERVHKSLALECLSATYPVMDHATEQSLERDSNIIVSALEQYGMDPEPAQVRAAIAEACLNLHETYRENLPLVLFDALARFAEAHTTDGLL